MGSWSRAPECPVEGPVPVPFPTSPEENEPVLKMVFSFYGPHNPIPAPPNCPYHLMETTKPLIEVHWGV